MQNKDSFKSGFVAIIGRPNVGKSTLLNQIVGQKIAIMSDKAQTTRNKIQGIYTRSDAQLVFIDTPGIHKPKNALGDFMNKSAYSSLAGVDAVLVMVNASEPIGPGDRFVIEKLEGLTIPVFLLINKVDLIQPQKILSVISDYKDLYPFTEVIPLSAKSGDNVDLLLDQLINLLPEGPQYYPTDQLMDHPEYFVVAELIREKILHLTREEVPHSVAVQVQSMQKNEEDKVEVHANIIVERKSQKGIIIGAQGSLIKKIRQLARRDIERLLGNKIALELWVKIQKDWRDRPTQLDDLGYQDDNY